MQAKIRIVNLKGHNYVLFPIGHYSVLLVLSWNSNLIKKRIKKKKKQNCLQLKK